MFKKLRGDIACILERDPAARTWWEVLTCYPGLHAIYIDSGTRDQYYLDLGATGFRRALERIGVTDVFFELFDGTHSSIEYRYPIALRYLSERLSGT